MKRLILLLLFLGIFSSGTAFAACSATSNTASFGSLSSFAVASNSQMVQTAGYFTCTGSNLSVGSTNTLTATLVSSTNASGTTPRLYSSSGGYIPYTLCGDNACSTTYKIGSTQTWSSNQLVQLNLNSTLTIPLTLYLKSSSGVNIPAGTYNDTLTINWTYNICLLGLGVLCISDSGTKTSTIGITLVVTKDCAIDSAPDVSFGSAAFPINFSKISSSLVTRCTKNSSYKVSLASSNASVGDWRQMKASTSSGTSYLQYQLQKSDGSIWTESLPLSLTGTGIAQTINYTALINPSQTNQPAGSYSDTVTVTVTY